MRFTQPSNTPKVLRITRQSSPDPQQSLQDFLIHLQQTDAAPNTISAYHNDIRAFLRFYQHAYPQESSLANLQPACLVHFRQTMLHEHKLSAATVNRRLNALRRFCRFCLHTGRMTQNPAARLKSMRVAKRTRPRGLATRETYALIQATMPLERHLALRNHALFHLLLQTGLRVGEAAALLVDDLVIYDRSGCVHVRDGKGHRQRAVPLNATARKALRRYLDTREDARDGDPAFVTERGTPLSVRSIQVFIVHLARRAGLKRKISAHTLRHAFALAYLRDNPDGLIKLMHLLGHESVETTAVYLRSSEQDMADDLERSQFNVEAGLVAD